MSIDDASSTASGRSSVSAGSTGPILKPVTSISMDIATAMSVFLTALEAAPEDVAQAYCGGADGRAIMTEAFQTLEQMASTVAQGGAKVSNASPPEPVVIVPAEIAFGQFFGGGEMGISAESFAEDFKDGCKSVEDFKVVQKKLEAKNPRMAKGNKVANSMFTKTKLTTETKPAAISHP